MMLLPDLPSELIRVALADLKKCEADSCYKINMNKWHAPGWGSACSVCFAGSVMAKSLKANSGSTYRPSDFGYSSDTNSLYALNFFRVGCIEFGLDHLNKFSVLKDREIVDYEDNALQFHEEMHVLANDLQELGL